MLSLLFTLSLTFFLLFHTVTASIERSGILSQSQIELRDRDALDLKSRGMSYWSKNSQEDSKRRLLEIGQCIAIRRSISKRCDIYGASGEQYAINNQLAIAKLEAELASNSMESVFYESYDYYADNLLVTNELDYDATIHSSRLIKAINAFGPLVDNTGTVDLAQLDKYVSRVRLLTYSDDIVRCLDTLALKIRRTNNPGSREIWVPLLKTSDLIAPSLGEKPSLRKTMLIDLDPNTRNISTSMLDENNEWLSSPAVCALVIRSLIQIKSKDAYGKALEYISKAVAIQNDPTLFFYAGVCHQSLGNLRDAISYYRAATLLNPSLVVAYVNSSRCKILIRDYDGTENDISIAIGYKPSWLVLSFYRMSLAIERMGAQGTDFSQHRVFAQNVCISANALITLANDALSSDPNDTGAYLYMSEGRLSLAQYIEGIASIDKYLAQGGKRTSRAKNLKAKHLWNSGSYDEGLKLLSEGVASEPNNIERLLDYARFQCLSGQYTESKATYEKAQTMQPNSLTAKDLMYLGRINKYTPHEKQIGKEIANSQADGMLKSKHAYICYQSRRISDAGVLLGCNVVVKDNMEAFDLAEILHARLAAYCEGRKMTSVADMVIRIEEDFQAIEALADTGKLSQDINRIRGTMIKMHLRSEYTSLTRALEAHPSTQEYHARIFSVLKKMSTLATNACREELGY